VKRYLYIVDVLYKFIGRLFILAVEGGEVECINRVAIEGGIIFLDNSVIAVDSHRPIIMRD